MNYFKDQSSVDDGSTCLPTDSSLISIQNMSTTTSTPKRALKQLTARVLTPNSSNWAETMKIPVKYSRVCYRNLVMCIIIITCMYGIWMHNLS